MGDEQQVVVSDVVRAAGRDLLERLPSDEALRARLADDPAAVFAELGIPQELMPVLATVALDGAEVAGYAVHALTTIAPSTFGQAAMTATCPTINATPTAMCNPTVNPISSHEFWYAP